MTDTNNFNLPVSPIHAELEKYVGFLATYGGKTYRSTNDHIGIEKDYQGLSIVIPLPAVSTLLDKYLPGKDTTLQVRECLRDLDITYIYNEVGIKMSGEVNVDKNGEISVKFKLSSDTLNSLPDVGQLIPTTINLLQTLLNKMRKAILFKASDEYVVCFEQLLKRN